MKSRIRTVMALTAVAVLLATMAPAPVSAGSFGSNVGGMAAAVEECGGATSIITLALEGDFEGCLYTDEITQAGVRANGVYVEHGFETIVGCVDTPDGEMCGTLSTSFVFMATFAPDGTQLTGGCVHPILGGTGDFAGVSGVIVFHDDVAAGTAEYRGLIELP